MPDEGWVRIYHPDQLEDPDVLPDPDDPDYQDNTKFATVTVESYELAWQRRGWRNLDEDLAGASVGDMPDTAAGRNAWIDEGESDHARKLRAQVALDDEIARGDDGRSTVIAHAESVLADTSTEDQTTSTTFDEES